MTRTLIRIGIASLLAAPVALAQGAAPAQAPAEAPAAEAKLIDAQGKAVGTAKLAQTPHGVLISVDLHGLKPGLHAIHLHETGKCEPPFKTAGGHFNPGHKSHGYMTAEGPHAGDMPNLDVPANGKLKADLIAADATLETLLDADGAALVLHAKADDYKSQPAGDAGDRVACGVIQK
jgi:superoxide dismutase, Cu-Zn family